MSFNLLLLQINKGKLLILKKIYVVHNYKIKKNLDYKKFRRRSTSRFRSKRRTHCIKNNIYKPNDYENKYKLLSYNSKKKYYDYKWIKAPEIFSLNDNANDTLDFIRNIEINFLNKKKVFINLEDVKVIGHGAIVVLLSKMVLFKSNNVDFNGNMPKDKKMKKLIKDSGFFENLYTSFNLESKYKIIPSSHKIYTHADKNVDSILAADIIEKSSIRIWGVARRCLGLYRVLIELMHNTNNHASNYNIGEKHWWLSVNYDEKNNKVCFSFIDFGVGILESLKCKKPGAKFYGALTKLFQVISPNDTGKMLNSLLNGQVHKTEDRTSTGNYYRGKGLPGIKNACANNDISNLLVVSNDAYVDTKNNKVENLKGELKGTFIYWELTSNNKNLKNEN